MIRAFRILVGMLLFVVAGCSGSVDFTPLSHFAPGGSALTATSNGAVVANVALVVGGTSTSTLSIAEGGYSGIFTATSSNAGVVTVAAGAAPAATARSAQSTSTASGSGTFTLTAVGGGSATLTISDANGNSTSLPVNVTSTAAEIFSSSR